MKGRCSIIKKRYNYERLDNDIDNINNEISTLMSKSQKKRRLSLLYKILFIVLVLCIASVVSMQIFFKIETINVAGLTRYTMEEVIETSKLNVGDSIFSLDKHKIEKTIYEKHSYFSDVNINILLPSSIDIVVTEAVESYVFLNNEDSYSIVGDNHRILKTEEGTYFGDLPKFVGIDLSELPVGYEITEKHIKKLEGNLKALEEKQSSKNLSEEQKLEIEEKLDKLSNEMYELVRLNKYLDMIDRIYADLIANNIDKICYIDVSDGISVTIFYDYRAIIRLGSELDFDYKLKFLNEMFLKLGDSFKGTINMESFSVNKKAYTKSESIGKYVHKSFIKRYY